MEYHEEEKNLFGQISNQDNRKVPIAGIRYTLPMLVVADARIDQTGTMRFQLSREDIPITTAFAFKFYGEYRQGIYDRVYICANQILQPFYAL